MGGGGRKSVLEAAADDEEEEEEEGRGWWRRRRKNREKEAVAEERSWWKREKGFAGFSQCKKWWEDQCPGEKSVSLPTKCLFLCVPHGEKKSQESLLGINNPLTPPP